MEKLTRLDYLKCREDLNGLGFTDKEITKALDQCKLTVNLLTDLNGYKQEPKYLKAYEVTKRSHSWRGKEYRGEFEREVTMHGIECRVPSNYQGLRHGEIIEALMCNKFDWFNTFTVDKNYTESETGEYFDFIGRLNVNSLPKKYLNMTVAELVKRNQKKDLVKKKSAWSLYEMYNVDSYDIYLTTDNGSLYVPIKALLNGDIDAIKNRLITYSKSYYVKKEDEDKREKMVAPIHSDQAKRLFELINTTKR